MKRTLIVDIEKLETADIDILVKGWVRTKRGSKKFSFLTINDGSNMNGIQVIVDGDLENYDEITKLTTGGSVAITGKLVESPGNQKFEIQAKTVKIYGFADPEEYPIQKKNMTLEYLREYPHLRPRTNTYSAIFRIRHSISFAVHEFFNNEGFKYIHTPIITGADAEGAGEMFQVTTLDMTNVPKAKDGSVDYKEDFFDKPMNLTVSGQLAVENFCASLGDVYTFGPTFRAENSNTTRHLCEFWMIEPEIAFADLEDDMNLAENFLQYIINYCLKNNREDLEFLNKQYDDTLIERLENVVSNKFARITYTEAIDILKKCDKKFDFKVEWGIDLQTEHERFLCEDHFSKPTIVTDYPKAIKAFYMKENADGKTVAAMDVLCPGVGEIIGGAQREDNYEKLVARIEEDNMDPKELQWYLDLRKFGTHPHAGFGLGFERAVLFITGMSNIRDVIPFPRTPGHADC